MKTTTIDPEKRQKVKLKIDAYDAALLAHLVAAECIRERDKCQRLPGSEDTGEGEMLVVSEGLSQAHSLHERVMEGLSNTFTIVSREHTEEEIEAIEDGEF
jgi:hypothetical protein